MPSCVLFVSATTGSDSNSGAAWSSATSTVPRALSLASAGCEVWIAVGTYFPGTEQSSTFSVPAGVSLRGGFEGHERRPEERPSAGLSVLSGELGDELEREDNVHHVVTTHEGVLLDRLEVTGGWAANLPANEQGGAGIAALGRLEIKDCTLHHNTAGTGGAVRTKSVLTIVGSSFSSNIAYGYGGAIAATDGGVVSISSSYFASNDATDGGGLHLERTSLNLEGTTFINNGARGAGAAIAAREAIDHPIHVEATDFVQNLATNGAAIYGDAPLEVLSSRFVSNIAGSQGQGVVEIGFTARFSEVTFSNSGGTALAVSNHGRPCAVEISDSEFLSNRGSYSGALFTIDCPVTLDSTAIYANSGGPGGAISAWGAQAALIVRRGTFTNNHGFYGGAISLEGAALELSDSEFSGNSAQEGGAIWADDEAVVVLTNATLTRNMAEAGGALELAGSGSLRNCIVWANVPGEFRFTGSPEQLNISTSNLSGYYPNLIGFDPEFVDPESDFRLREESPCIDTGSDDTASDRDLANQERRDIPGLPVCSTSAPNCGAVADMGAYEFAR